MSVADIRTIAKEARPAIEQWLDAAELITGFRELATEKGLEWSQLKAAIVAQIKDGRDGGDRLQKLATRADSALTYADALSENKFNFQSAATNGSEAAAPEPADKKAAASSNSQTAASSPEETPERCSAGGEPASSVPPTPADGAGSTIESVAMCLPASGGGAACERQFHAAPTLSDEFNSIPAFLARERVSV